MHCIRLSRAMHTLTQPSHNVPLKANKPIPILPIKTHSVMRALGYTFSHAKNIDDRDKQVLQTNEKSLVFKEYSSLQNSTRDKFIKTIRTLKYDSKDILWVASQKIHGANFSIHFNGQLVKYGRRNDFITKDIPVSCKNIGDYFNQNFFGAKNLVAKFHHKLQDIYDNIKQFDPKLLKFVIYGQYFGGCWPEDHFQYVKTSKQVQSGIYYTPNHQFYAFDIFITNSQSDYWADVTDIPKLLKGLIPSVPIYAKGTFDQVYSINTEISSTVPQLLGLQRLKDNLVEGMVIRPNRDLTTIHNQKVQRVIIKKKNQEFVEKMKEPKKQVSRRPQDPQIAQLIDQLAIYVNANRIINVRSKYPDLTNRKKLKGFIINDILIDAEKDQVKLPLDQEKHRQVIRELKIIVNNQMDSSIPIVKNT